MLGTLNISDAYMDMLCTLPYEDKLKLITKLANSLKQAVAPTMKAKKDVFASFSSDWGEGMDTEDYADMLRSGNVESARIVETW